MTNEEAKKMLKAKLECFKNEISGINHDCNMRLCDGCSLNYEQGNMGEQKEALDMAIKALEQTRWIPVSERLPEKPYGCIVTVMDTNPMTCDEFENIYPDFVGWDGENWNDADGDSIPFEVIAWMPLPEPYAESEEV